MDNVFYPYLEFARISGRSTLVPIMRPQQFQFNYGGPLAEWSARIWRSALRLTGPRRSVENRLARLSISPHARANTGEDHLVVLDTASGRVFKSNRNGALVWRALAANRSWESIAGEFSAQYGVPLGEASKTTLDFVRQLWKLGLVSAR